MPPFDRRAAASHIDRQTEPHLPPRAEPQDLEGPLGPAWGGALASSTRHLDAQAQPVARPAATIPAPSRDLIDALSSARAREPPDALPPSAPSTRPNRPTVG